VTIKLRSMNAMTGDIAEYTLAERSHEAAVSAFWHFLRGRGWSAAQIAASKVERVVLTTRPRQVCITSRKYFPNFSVGTESRAQSALAYFHTSVE